MRFLFLTSLALHYLCGCEDKGVPTHAHWHAAEIIPLRPDAVNAAGGIAFNYPAFLDKRALAGRRLCPLLRIYFLTVISKYMQVFVNNKEVLTDASLLSSLIQQLELPAAGVAVAIDNKMVPRTEWDKCTLQAGAHITIIKAACGG